MSLPCWTLVAGIMAAANASAATLQIATTKCPGGTQGSAYAGCAIIASGGTPPYSFAIDPSASYAPLPEGLTIDAASGAVSGPVIGGQGSYGARVVVTDSAGGKAGRVIGFAIVGSNAALASIFPANSIFHHRVDAATTALPVDASPAAPIPDAYKPAALRAFFGGQAYQNLPNGIPALVVPATQPAVPVKTTVYQSYFSSAPIPAYAPVEGTARSAGGDRHVLILRQAGAGLPPALFEMWQGIYKGPGWSVSSNARWGDVSGNALTKQGKGTSDAAGLPVAPLLLTADEVIGGGTPAAPTGVVRHPVRFTVNHMVNYWVWPATATAGVGSCTGSAGTIPTSSRVSQTKPPASCTWSGPAGEIYRLRADVATPACAATSPQAAVIITGLRNYGIILADNGASGGLIGTPDPRWNDTDLTCLHALTLGDFEPVNVGGLILSVGSGATAK